MCLVVYAGLWLRLQLGYWSKHLDMDSPYGLGFLTAWGWVPKESIPRRKETDHLIASGLEYNEGSFPPYSIC